MQLSQIPQSRAVGVPILSWLAVRDWVVIGLVVLMGVATVVDPASAGTTATLGMLIGMGYAGMLCIGRSRRLDGRERIAWSLIGAGQLSGAVGVLVVGVLELAVGSMPAFGPTDAFFVLSYVLLLAGVFVLPHVGGRWLQRMLLIVDGLVGAISIATLAWLWFLSDLVIRLREAPVWDRALGLAYPILDVTVVIVVTVMVVRRTSLRFDLRLIVLSVAILAQSMADLSFVLSAAGRPFSQAQPIFPLFMVSAASMALLGSIVHRVPAAREYPDQRVPWWSLVTPYAAATVMVGVFLHALDSVASREVRVLAFTSTTVFALAIARQAFAIRENRNRVEQERRAFVSSLSHELRTPLTSMVGFVDIVRSQPELGSQERGEMLDIVNDQIQYLSRIVSDLVILAREDPEAMDLKRNNLLVSAAFELAVASVDPGEGRIDREALGDLVVNVDGQRLQQVLMNLVSNSVRYGGGRTLVRAVAEGDDLIIEVHDDGEGVPPKYQVVIWDRFERGIHRYDARTPGSGIGLAVVSAVAKAHGGYAKYRPSERLGGACFSVRFPGAIVYEPVEDQPIGEVVVFGV